MEVIGAVASIGGVIQLALHGIKFVEFLKTFAEIRGTEAAADFVSGLVAYAQLLHDVQALCDCIQQHRNPCVSQIRIATLRLCPEVCVQDLEAWHDIAKRLERTDLRVRHGGNSQKLGISKKGSNYFCVRLWAPPWQPGMPMCARPYEHALKSIRPALEWRYRFLRRKWHNLKPLQDVH